MFKTPIIICGPTASGKSLLANMLAEKLSGEIINADSAQIYDALQILTASPSEVDKAKFPHHLYNFMDILDNYSVARYLDDFQKIYIDIQNRGIQPIIVGGTGLYISALINGIAEIPNIDPEIREETQELLSKIGNEEFYKQLVLLDSIAATKLNPGDSQRMQRAYEVKKQTGKSIFEYHQNNSAPIVQNAKIIVLNPERKFLYHCCDSRMEQMLEDGAIEEVQNLLAKLEKVGNKAIGLREIADYLQKKISVDQALKLAQQKTRNYAKRQITWFKHQVEDKLAVDFLNEFEAKKKFTQLIFDIKYH